MTDSTSATAPSASDASTWTEYRPLRSAERALNHSPTIANTYGMAVTPPTTRYEPPIVVLTRCGSHRFRP